MVRVDTWWLRFPVTYYSRIVWSWHAMFYNANHCSQPILTNNIGRSLIDLANGAQFCALLMDNSR